MKPYIRLIKTVWANGKSWHRSIIGYYAAYIIAQGLYGLVPYAFGQTVDLLQHFQPDQLSTVIFWLVFGVVLLPLFWLFHGPARVVERKVAVKIQQQYLLDVYTKLTHLPLKWHQDHHTGNVITRLNRAATSLKNFAGDQFIYIENIIKFVFSIGFLLWISLPVGILSLLSCSLATLTVVLFDRKLVPLYESENDVENYVGAGLFDYISNMTTILTLRLGSLTKHNLSKRLLSLWTFLNREVVLNEVKWFSMGMVLTCLQSTILIGYILYSLQTTQFILIGTVVMIFRYQHDLSEVFYNLSTHYSTLVRMDTDIQGMQPILDEIQQSSHQGPALSQASKWKTISISDLHFRHQGSGERGVIHPLSFQLKRGEKIALIGSSGGGKSTVLNLLSGLYTPDGVTLVVDGVKFNTLAPLQAITTLIPQEPELFENTLGFNITLGLDATSEELDQIIKLSGFAEVLSTLPLGLETDIREKGLNLSVGQKQRLALARGLFAARFSSLVLMDEPTSSVDLQTEKKILSAVIKKYPDATMMVSLHRLHLLPQFDRIMMLHHGKVVAEGETRQLLKTQGPVKDLWEKYQSRTSDTHS